MVIRRWLWAIGVGMAMPLAALAAAVSSVRLEAQPGRTALHVDVNAPVQYRLFTLSGPDRVVLDVLGAQLSTSALPLPAAVGAVRQVRAANRADGSVRVVFDLSARVQPHAVPQRAGGRGENRITVELLSNAAPDATQATAAPRGIPNEPAVTAGVSAAATPAVIAPAPEPDIRIAPPPPAPAASPPAAPAVADASLVGRDIIIAVDAGHGGHDPGAHGPTGIREKDVTLRISRRLVEIINAEPGMKGILTRNRDEFLPLRSRMERARAAQADLFVSIHADAVRNRKVRGASVYVLNEKGATDEAARRLAARENAADLVGGVSLGDKDPVLRSVLLDLSQSASLGSSIEVGDEILHAMTRVGVVRKPQVMQAPFMVLKSPDVPSVLVETAYISNPEEERNLASDAWRSRLARAVFTGIRQYFYANPPPGTLVASRTRQRLADSLQHVISNGETLSAIASRYNVSVTRIRAANGLRGDQVNVGQVLRIPRTQET
jgi:N-acetylmuramoyl-L-alanine amidase